MPITGNLRDNYMDIEAIAKAALQFAWEEAHGAEKSLSPEDLDQMYLDFLEEHKELVI